MNQTASIAASLPPEQRKKLAIKVLAQNEPITHLAAREKVSRKFLYQQKSKASSALNQAFSPICSNQDVLFYLPVTNHWLKQLILSLILICHSSYRGVKELLRDLFDTPISIASIHNLVHSTALKAKQINDLQDLSSIQSGLHDEIFQGSQPVLAGVDAFSTYSYLLSIAEHRDEDTWGVHLLDLKEKQGLNPDYTIALWWKRTESGTSSRMAGNTMSWRCFSHPISMYTISFIFRTPSYGGYYTMPKTRDTDGKSEEKAPRSQTLQETYSGSFG